jgi:hypothetical protein
MPPVVTRDFVDQIASGMSLIVGSVDHEGGPHAGRAWGCRSIGTDGQLRILLDARDAQSLANLTVGRPVALTVTEVNGFVGCQMKGTVTLVEEPRPDDVAAAEVWCANFLKAINDVDGYSTDGWELWKVTECVAAEIAIDVIFDQAPGPGAGRQIEKL